MLVKLYAPLKFNVSGHDPEPLVFPEGEVDVPDFVAQFVAANPSVGEVLVAKSVATVAETFEQDVEAAVEAIEEAKPKTRRRKKD